MVIESMTIRSPYCDFHTMSSHPPAIANKKNQHLRETIFPFFSFFLVCSPYFPIVEKEEPYYLDFMVTSTVEETKIL